MADAVATSELPATIDEQFRDLRQTCPRAGGIVAIALTGSMALQSGVLFKLQSLLSQNIPTQSDKDRSSAVGSAMGYGQQLRCRGRCGVLIWRPHETDVPVGKGRGHVIDQQTKIRGRVRVTAETR